MLQPLIFLLISFILLLVSGIYVTRRLIRPMHLPFVFRRSLITIVCIAFTLAFIAPGITFMARRGIVDFQFANTMQGWAYPFLGYMSILITILIIEDILIIIRKTVYITFWHMHLRRFLASFLSHFRFLRNNHHAERTGRLIVFLASLIVFSVAFQNGQKTHVTQHKLPVLNLAPGFEGYKIALISDMHIGPVYDRRLTERIVEKTNAAAPDLIVIAGDAADGLPENLEDGMAPLKLLRAKDGVVYATGNHEYYWDAPAWINAFDSLGFDILMNNAKLIRRGASTLAVGGVPDRQGKNFVPDHIIDISKTFSQAPHDANTTWLLVAHQPKVVEDAIAAGVDIQLSGHTHGGQFFPWTLVVQLAQKYPRGLFELGNTTLFVSMGAGAWGPPLRLGALAEIPILTLEPKKL
jgi:predicted MPP superfamily phosphohydrolase